jgi:hypothetical protein
MLVIFGSKYLILLICLITFPSDQRFSYSGENIPFTSNWMRVLFALGNGRWCYYGNNLCCYQSLVALQVRCFTTHFIQEEVFTIIILQAPIWLFIRRMIYVYINIVHVTMLLGLNALFVTNEKLLSKPKSVLWKFPEHLLGRGKSSHNTNTVQLWWWL